MVGRLAQCQYRMGEVGPRPWEVSSTWPWLYDQARQSLALLRDSVSILRYISTHHGNVLDNVRVIKRKVKVGKRGWWYNFGIRLHTFAHIKPEPFYLLICRSLVFLDTRMTRCLQTLKWQDIFFHPLHERAISGRIDEVRHSCRLLAAANSMNHLVTYLGIDGYGR